MHAINSFKFKLSVRTGVSNTCAKSFMALSCLTLNCEMGFASCYFYKLLKWVFSCLAETTETSFGPCA